MVGLLVLMIILWKVLSVLGSGWSVSASAYLCRIGIPPNGGLTLALFTDYSSTVQETERITLTLADCGSVEYQTHLRVRINIWPGVCSPLMT